ncbi:MAG: DUF835 domain-containing protein [Methanobacteriota archaeon]|nr:MAG: DUF835 domain-containing protein [Euryarchaeota archaeon]
MSRRHLLTVLLTGLFLVALAPVAQAPVTVVTVATDRSDYFVGMAVSANATIQYTGSFIQINEPARVEWFNATWVLQRIEYVPKVRVSNTIATAAGNWTPVMSGAYHVNVTANQTNGSPPIIYGSAPFRAWALSDYVIARGIEVSMVPSGFERGQVATTVANFTAKPGWVLGNVSRLERVQFIWYYPSTAVARQATVNVANGEATDAWAPDVVGASYRVTATYLGNDTVSNATSFPVYGPSTPATNVTAGTTRAWDLARSPWRVCGDLLVDATATLTIEAGVTVKFCPSSRLFVAGTLTGDGSPVARINLTSGMFPPSPGDWGGVHFLAGGSGRLVNAIVEHVTDAVGAVDSSPTIIGLVARDGTGDGVNLIRSAGIVRDATIEGFGTGLHVENATATIANVSIADPDHDGVFVVDDPGIAIQGLRVAGGENSLRAVDSDNLRVEGGSFSGATSRAVNLAGSAAVLANVSIASPGQDFLLVDSIATVLNCTFTDVASERTIIAPSRLAVANFLSVRVATSDGRAVAGAAVSVTVDGASLSSRVTDGQGLAAWIAVEDRVITATATSTHVVTVSVSRDGYAIAGSPRTVDMASSRLESFVATQVSPSAAVVLVGLFAAVLIVVGVLVLRRRDRTETVEAAPSPTVAPEVEPVRPPKPAPPVDLVPGSSYVLLAETPDAAFRQFAKDVRGGRYGLCISRLRPEDARDRFGIADVPVYWLSRSFGKEMLSPTNLGAIVDLVRTYTADKPGCRVLVDGLEYLYTQNDFGKVVKFVNALADVAAQRGAVLLFILDPKSLDPDRLAVLTRDLRPWS